MPDIAVSADGLSIAYEVQGQGRPALLFIHGWAGRRSYWQKQLRYLASQYTVVALDLGGHGDSGRNRAAWTMAAFGQDVVAVVEQLRLIQVVLTGHSMGGTVSVEAAQQMPGRVIGIVAVDTFKNLDQTCTRAEINAFLAPFQSDFVQAAARFVRSAMFIPTSDAALVDRIAADMASIPAEVGIGTIEHYYSHDAQRRAGLKAVQVPKVLIMADSTPIDKAAAEHYGIRVESVPGVGHYAMLEDPETFNHILADAVLRMAR